MHIYFPKQENLLCRKSIKIERGGCSNNWVKNTINCTCNKGTSIAFPVHVASMLSLIELILVALENFPAASIAASAALFRGPSRGEGHVDGRPGGWNGFGVE